MMNAQSDATEPADERRFAALDQYVERLQRGDTADREQLVHDHPELACAAECIEALEKLALLGPSGLAEPRLPYTSSLLSSGTVTLDFPSAPPGPAGGGRAEPCAFGDYELLSEIGRGGMGVVYRARQKSLDRTVAIKMILSRQLASQDQVRRFQAEARAAASLSHPNIVHIFEVGQLHGQHYFAMQHVAGTSLAQVIRDETYSLEARLRMLVAVARAVDHLHAHGIVHRDLKPANILVDEHGQPYVTDFGLAKIFAGDSEQTATGFIAGTPSYMAPEQAWPDTAPIGPLADVYSLGAILYEMLTGQPPFREENPLDTLLSVRSREPTLPRQLNPRVPRSAEIICLKCLEKSPERRYASAAELADDLERYLKGEQLAARPPHGWRRLARWGRRQPALALRLSALGAFFAIVVADWYFLGNVSDAFFYRISGIVVVWMAASILFQQLLSREYWPTTAIFAWAAVDVLLLTAALKVGSGVISPMLFGYWILIVGSGLWYRARLVGFTVGMSVVSYLTLMAEMYRFPSAQELPVTVTDPVRHVLFVVTAIILGGVTTYQVSRLRALSEYYEQRRPT